MPWSQPHDHSETAIAAGDDIDHHDGSNPRPRAMTSTATTTAEIDSTISHPGSVRINVKGAFIVDGTEQPSTPANGYTNGSYHEGKDIRLPNHTAVVSHIAVDVSIGVVRDCRHKTWTDSYMDRSVALLPSSSTSPAKRIRPSPVGDSTSTPSKQTILTTVSGSCDTSKIIN